MDCQRWRVTEQNQRAKFYQLTREGRKQLVRDRSKWEAIVEAMAGVLESRVQGVEPTSENPNVGHPEMFGGWR